MTPKQFALVIEKRASTKKISHMDAVLNYCEEKPATITLIIFGTLWIVGVLSN